MWLPQSQRRDEIHFKLAKSLPYHLRMIYAAGFAALGFGLQFFLPGWFGLVPGGLCLLTASLLSLVRGYSNVPKRIRGSRQWRGADRKQLEQVLNLNKNIKHWDQSLLDITCVRGIAAMIGIVASVTGIGYLLWLNDEDWLLRVWVLDTALLILPHWITGVRTILTNDPLVIKAKQLLRILDIFETVRGEDDALDPQMEVRSAKAGEMPLDAKLIYRRPGGDANFLGLQIQCTLNNVQGTDYPYLYCVLVARHAFKLLEKGKNVKRSAPAGITVSPKHEEDVDIIVIRQYTTKKSGYHTKPAACAKIFHFALDQAREILKTGVKHIGKETNHGID